ncbi:pentapeptide repeat-containing protein [Mastigocoleus sp. MO_188.B34]|uniref:pentapeptide repeat-containing protein n=1 Tax=Mastigocoleus sp. MO_188.B34 TaxID=3036635 RepID=UPI00262A635C|nr:pentapeptide repeat-containing protein [Mastigocoleus sp. MO_188.B34]MDJ0693758.1 pentapeptide repeat-containing protein [Mastigocoleus sp. MO_188.B34]
MTNQRKKLGKFFYKDIWQVLRDNSKKIDITSNDISKIISNLSIELAIELGFIANYIENKDLLVDKFSIAGIATEGIRFYCDTIEGRPSLEEYALITCRLAYIESFENILRTTANQSVINQISKLEISKLVVSQEYTNIEDNLEFELRMLDPNKAIHCFHETKIAKYFNKNCFSFLKTTDLTTYEANTLIQRIAWNAQRYIDLALSSIAGLQTRYFGLRKSTWRKKLTKYKVIDDYLELHIGKQCQETICTEQFTLQDIYVPLKAQRLNKKGQIDKKQLPIDLEGWTINLLKDPKKQDKIIWIQAEAGKGKTVFCRMFSEYIRLNLHPVWTPILVNVRDIKKVGQSFEDTLKIVLDKDFCIVSDDNWLKDKNTRYLFLLDGLDDFLLQDRSSCSLIEFISQIANFQEKCQQNSVELGHRILLTTRSSILQGIESNLPTNLERAKILPMDNHIQKQWLNNWSAQVGIESALAFQQFLQDQNCPNIVQELAQEPLLLYLLAAIHRNSELTVEMFECVNSTQAKIKIYQEALKSVFPQQKNSIDFIHKSFSDFLSAVNLKTKLKEWIKPGMCSTGFHISQNIMDLEIYDWLGCDSLTPEIVDYLMNLLAQEFSLKPSLYASSRFDISLISLSVQNKDEYLSTTSVTNGTKSQKLSHIRNSWEVNDNIPELLQLFQRIENFHRRWCEGEFIDTHEQNLPQKKSLQLHLENIYLGQRQIDIYVGLNITILLLELQRINRKKEYLKTKIIFNPSTPTDKINSWKFQLLRIINYSDLIHPGTFNSVVGQFLRGVDLSNIDLRGVSLSGANLRSADLRGTYLRGADLSNAYLNGADLSGADLNGINLRGAYLRGVNLSGANLMGADLSESDLRGADLRNIDLRGAHLSRANLRSSDLSNMDLRGAKFEGANLEGVNLSNANLSSADFRGAQLNNANLREAQLSTADLRGVRLSNADLRGAKLNNANFRGAHLKGTNISNADLSGADLRGARLLEAKLSDGFLGDISWNKHTKWEGVRSWKTAYKVPESLKQQLDLQL